MSWKFGVGANNLRGLAIYNPSASYALTGPQSHTAMFWAYPMATGIGYMFGVIASDVDFGAQDGWYVELSSTTKFSYQWLNNYNGTTYRSGAVQTINRWYHVAFVYKHPDMSAELYVNGSLDTSSTEVYALRTAVIAPAAGWALASDNFVSNSANVKIACTRVFGGQLSQAEIQAEMHAPYAVNRRLPVLLDHPALATGPPGTQTASAGGWPVVTERGLYRMRPYCTGAVAVTERPPLNPDPPPRASWLLDRIKPDKWLVSLDQILETDTANTLGALKLRGFGQATETSEATAFGRVKLPAIALVTEDDLAQLVGGLKLRSFTPADETDTAGTTVPVKLYHLHDATEDADVYVITVVKTPPLGQVVETDSAGAFAALKSSHLGQTLETQLASAIAATKAHAVALAVEVSTAGTIVPIKLSGVGQAIELDLASAISTGLSEFLCQILSTAALVDRHSGTTALDRHSAAIVSDRHSGAAALDRHSAAVVPDRHSATMARCGS